MEVYSLLKSYFKQNYCHACHTRFAVFYPLPSCCVFVTTMKQMGDHRAFQVPFPNPQLQSIALSLLSNGVIAAFTESIGTKRRTFLADFGKSL